LDYLAAVYAVPAAGADYLFYPEETVQFEALLLNKGSVPVTIRMSADPSTHISLSTRSALSDSTPLTRQAWTVASDQIRIRPRDSTEVLVGAGSSVVLHPDAALIIPITINDAAKWPIGSVIVAADWSLECEPACAVVPHSNVFRFEVRTTLDRIDRMESGYRRALRAFLAADWDGAEHALRLLDAEDSNTATGLNLHALVAERRGHRVAAHEYYRSAEAALSRSDAPDVKNMGSSFDEFLNTIRSSIRRLENVR
jgi:hypothetical protein